MPPKPNSIAFSIMKQTIVQSRGAKLCQCLGCQILSRLLALTEDLSPQEMGELVGQVQRNRREVRATQKARRLSLWHHLGRKRGGGRNMVPPIELDVRQFVSLSPGIGMRLS